MTKEEFAERMQKIATEHKLDPEAAHYEADQLIVEFLYDIGCLDATDIFVSMTKWYA